MGVSAILLCSGLVGIDSLSVHEAGRRVGVPLIRLLAFITIGLAMGQIIEARGWTCKLGRLGDPLFRFARLGSHCSAAFSTAFISGVTANAMLYDFWKQGSITRYQLIMTNLANQLPAHFLHLPTTIFIVLPLTGWAGVLYFLLTLMAAVLRLLLVLTLGRWRPAMGSNEITVAPAAGEAKRSNSEIWPILRDKLPRRLASVVTYVVPIYIAVFLLNTAGLFDWTRKWLAHWVAESFVPIESLSLVVLSFAAEFTSGFAAAGALLQEGVLTTHQAVLALLIGNVVAFPIRALRHQLPRLMGIFAPKLGLQILLLGQGFRVVSLVVVGGLYYLMG
jgi:hypothetical protein